MRTCLQPRNDVMRTVSNPPPPPPPLHGGKLMELSAFELARGKKILKTEKSMVAPFMHGPMPDEG